MNGIRNAMGATFRFFDSPLFPCSFKNKMHYIQLSLVTIIIILTGVRIATKPKFLPVTRSDTLAIVMGAKTIIVIGYQLLTTHISNLKRWRNLKVYLVLNCLETLFWLAVVVMTAMGMSKYCRGSYCGLSIVVILLALVVAVLASWTVVVTQKLRKESESVAQPSLPTYQVQPEKL